MVDLLTRLLTVCKGTRRREQQEWTEHVLPTGALGAVSQARLGWKSQRCDCLPETTGGSIDLFSNNREWVQDAQTMIYKDAR